MTANLEIGGFVPSYIKQGELLTLCNPMLKESRHVVISTNSFDKLSSPLS